MNLVVLAILAIIGGIAIAALDAVVRRPVSAVRVVLGVLVLSTIITDSNLTSVELSGFRITLNDVVFTLVAGAAVVRLLRLRRTSPPQKALVIFVLMLLVSLIHGIVVFGLAPSVNEFRTYLDYAGVALYFSTVELTIDLRRALFKEFRWAGIALGGLVLVRWAARFGGFGLGVFDHSEASTLRVINGPETLTIASIALLLLYPALSRGRFKGDSDAYIGLCLLVVSIVLNRRTLWLGLVVATLLLIFRRPVLGRRLAGYGLLGVMIYALTATLLGGSLGVDVAISASNTSNLDWRIEGWRGLIENGPNEPEEWVTGLPFGDGYEREVSGSEIDVVPHNYYLQAFLRSGVIGLMAFAATFFLAASTLNRAPPNLDTDPLSPDVLFLLLVLQIVWLVAWSAGADQGVILGLAIATATRIRFSEKPNVVGAGHSLT